MKHSFLSFFSFFFRAKETESIALINSVIILRCINARELLVFLQTSSLDLSTDWDIDLWARIILYHAFPYISREIYRSISLFQYPHVIYLYSYILYGREYLSAF